MIVCDVETTGTDSLMNSIVSIGAVDFNRPDQQYYAENQMFDGAHWTADAFRVNGFTLESVTDPGKPTHSMAIRAFMAWMEQADTVTLAGGNPDFDRRFLEMAANRASRKWYGYRTVDLHSLVYADYLRRGLALPRNPKYPKAVSLWIDNCFCYTGLHEEPKPHNALTGAKMAAEGLNRMIFGCFLFDEFQGCPVPQHLVEHRSALARLSPGWTGR